MEQSKVTLKGNELFIGSPCFNYFSHGNFPDVQLSMELETFNTMLPTLVDGHTLVHAEDNLTVTCGQSIKSFKAIPVDEKMKSMGNTLDDAKSNGTNIDIDWPTVFSFFKSFRTLLPESKLRKLAEETGSNWCNGVHIDGSCIKVSNNLVLIKYSCKAIASSTTVNIDVQSLSAIINLGAPFRSYLYKGSLYLDYKESLMVLPLKNEWPDTEYLEKASCDSGLNPVIPTIKFKEKLDVIKNNLRDGRVYIYSDHMSNSAIRCDNFARVDMNYFPIESSEPMIINADVFYKVFKFSDTMSIKNRLITLTGDNLKIIMCEYKL